MIFSSPLFLFIFLPIVLAVYYLLPRKFRNGFLLAANLVFYGWGEPVFILLMVASIVANYLFGLAIEKFPVRKKTMLVLSVLVNLGLLGFFKYTNFFARIFLSIPGFEGIGLPEILLPIGISFYTFQAMSYVIDVYRGDVEAQHNLVTFGTYVSLFPQLIAGPIVRYKDVAEQLEYRRENLKQFSDGIKLFLVGLAKKVLIANQMGLLWDMLKNTPGENGILGSWVGIAAFTLQIYFDFSGYSDMACGLGKMFGFEFMKNFNYPYISKSITEFWRRWHISLSTWFRDYVYIPLGGNRKGTARLILNLLIVWSLTGFWHGADYNFIMWGVYYFAILVLEKFLLDRPLHKLPGVVTHTYAMFFIMIGWTIFSFEDLGAMGAYFTSMFSVGGAGLIGADAASAALSFLPVIAVGIAASLPVWKAMYYRFQNKKWMLGAEVAIVAGVLVLCTAALVSETYNPFLYFRF
ncbi:MAG: MBOAT family protein [Christensenella sp.]|nr:MBOAT family protein [Christensenella sp.]